MKGEKSMLTPFIRLFAILSWVSIFFMPSNAIKRYMPVTILSALITVTVTFVGVNYNFWYVKGGIKTRTWNLLTIVLVLFPLGNLWIFYLTYRNFWLYLLANIMNNLVYAYKFIPFLEKIKFLKYKKFNQFIHIIVAMFYSLLLYGYQKIYEKQEHKLFMLNAKEEG